MTAGVTKSAILSHPAPAATALARRRGGLGVYPVRPGVSQRARTKRDKIPEYLTPEEVIAMLRAAPSVQARLLMLIMWRAGLRVSEALALVRADLSLDDKAPALRVRQGKGNRPRMVPVHLELAAALSNALGFMPGGQDQRIVPTTRRSALRWVTAAQAQLEGAGLLQPGRVVGNHTFRHSAARHWLASGVPINHVQRWLGHASLQTTLIYLTILPDPAGLMDRVP